MINMQQLVIILHTYKTKQNIKEVNIRNVRNKKKIMIRCMITINKLIYI
jgi:hypothetical protein